MALRKPLIERVQPHSLDAEAFVIGSMLSFKKNLPLGLGLLTPGDFYHEPYGLIFGATARLVAARKPVLAVQLVEELGPSLEAAGGKDDVTALFGSAFTAQGLAYHAGMVKEKSQLRALIRRSSRLLEDAFEHGAESNLLAAQAVADLEKIGTLSAEETGSPEALASWYFEKLEQRVEKSKTPGFALSSAWPSVNALCMLKRGQLAVMAGRPAMGKSALALAYAWHIAKASNVLVFSLEMGRDELLDRIVIGETTIKSDDINKSTLGETDWFQLSGFVANLRESKLSMYDPPELTAAKVERQIQMMTTAGRKPTLVEIDYLELMDLPEGDRHDLRLSALVRELKKIARKFDCVVLLLAQLNRKLEERANKRPMLSDLKNSGGIEEHADVVILLYRDDYYAAIERRESKKPGICEVIFAKHRNGATGTVDLDWDAEQQTFREPRVAWV